MSLKDKILKLLKKNNFSQDGYIITIFLFLAILFFKNVLFNNKLIYGWDVVHEYYYWRGWAFGLLGKGHLPLWNPYILSGYPFFADPQQAIFYPLNFIFLILPTHLAINYCFFLHILLAGIFMYFYMRELNIDKFSSLISGIVFMFNRFIIGRVFLGSLPQLCTLAWLPLLFLLVEKGIRKNSKYIFSLAGLIIGIQILAGHPQFSFYNIFAVCLYFIFRIISIYRNKKYQESLRLGYFFLLTILVGFLISAIQLIPTAYLLANSSRGKGLIFFTASISSLAPENIITLIAPDFLGNEVNTFYWGKFLFSLACPYIGIFSLIFILVALFFNRNKFTYFFFSLGVFSFLLAMGKYTPLFGIFYRFIPSFNMFRLISRWLSVFTFSVSALSGFGCAFLMRVLTKKERDSLLNLCKVLFVCLLILFLMVICFTYSGKIGNDIWEGFVRASLASGERVGAPIDTSYQDFFKNTFLNAKKSLNNSLFLITIILSTLFIYGKTKLNHNQLKVVILTVIYLDLFIFGTKYIIGYDQNNLKWNPEIISFFNKDKDYYRIATSLPVSALKLPHSILDNYLYINKNNQSYMHRGMIYNISNVGGELSSLISRYGEFTTGNFSASTEYNFTQNKKAADMLSVKYYIYPHDRENLGVFYHPLKDSSFQLVFSNPEIDIYKNTEALPKSLVVHMIEIIRDKEKILEKILNSTFDPRKLVILEDFAGDELKFRSQAMKSTSEVNEYAKIIDYKANKVKIVANLLEDGFLILNDIYFPGWRVYVNGKEDKIYQANYVFRAVQLRKGIHIVEFIFDPFYFKIGFLITIFTLTSLAVFNYIKFKNITKKGIIKI